MGEVETLVFFGEQSSQRVQLASATLLLYDHAINLADEVEHFWSGPWTFSRGMYLCIRYLGFMQVVVLILGIGTNTLSPLLCSFLLYGVEVAAIVLCQAAITIRVWHMFPHRPIIRSLIVMAYTAAILAAALSAAFLWPHVQVMIVVAGAARTPLMIWLYVPSLFLHSFLFALKVYRFMTSPRHLQRDSLLWRLLKEGMGMYACALGSLLFIVIGLTMTEASQIPVYDTALFGSVLFVALTIVSVCRAMLSIKSLAATVHVDPGWLLNHAELNRVHWRPGATEGEIVVDMSSDCYNLPTMSGLPNEADSPVLMGTKGASGPSGVTVSSSSFIHI